MRLPFGSGFEKEPRRTRLTNLRQFAESRIGGNIIGVNPVIDFDIAFRSILPKLHRVVDDLAGISVYRNPFCKPVPINGEHLLILYSCIPFDYPEFDFTTIVVEECYFDVAAFFKIGVGSKTKSPRESYLPSYSILPASWASATVLS